MLYIVTSIRYTAGVILEHQAALAYVPPLTPFSRPPPTPERKKKEKNTAVAENNGRYTK